jgi:hypothetical protein
MAYSRRSASSTFFPPEDCNVHQLTSRACKTCEIATSSAPGRPTIERAIWSSREISKRYHCSYHRCVPVFVFCASSKRIYMTYRFPSNGYELSVSQNHDTVYGVRKAKDIPHIIVRDRTTLLIGTPHIKTSAHLEIPHQIGPKMARYRRLIAQLPKVCDVCALAEHDANAACNPLQSTSHKPISAGVKTSKRCAAWS